MEPIDLIISIVLTIVLIVCFSHIRNFPEEKLHGDGYVPTFEGDSGLILPGDGEEMANTSIEPGSIPEFPEETEATEKFIHTSAESVCEFYEQTQIITREKNEVNEMIIAFWHGVAAVLIGEASALMVAFAWMKIRGGK